MFTVLSITLWLSGGGGKQQRQRKAFRIKGYPSTDVAKATGLLCEPLASWEQRMHVCIHSAAKQGKRCSILNVVSCMRICCVHVLGLCQEK